MYYQNQSDETLVMLTLAGEQTAYEVLVTRYQKAVISSAMVVVKNHFMAQDVAQDAFVTAWMKLNTLQEPNKYGSWVCRIAKNCALNMISRYRSYLPLETVEHINVIGVAMENPAEIVAMSQEKNEVNQSVEMLPKKVRQIIELYYFHNFSIAEIADQMRISQGTVKRQLHDGRKRIRKELCAMNEKYSDTLVQRVMKKVEELKLWQVKNDKSGFEKIYEQVLREVEELPECKEKQHALADVLMRGWWWLPGKKNDALFARITNAAIEGKNEEVMGFIVTREDSQVYSNAKIEFIRDKQIPRLEQAGFVKTLGREWFWLGYYLFREGKTEEGKAAYQKVEEILEKNDAYRLLVPYALKMEKELSTRYKGTAWERYLIGGAVEEYRMINGTLNFWNEECFGEGWLASIDGMSTQIFRNACSCDGCFFADISLGESFIGTDGTKLTYVSDRETVNTPRGNFENCQLWEVRRFTDTQKILCKTYYKEGVGIVRQDHITDGTTNTYLLSRYEIKGGRGFLPMFCGNTWEYETTFAPNVLFSNLKFTVSFADDKQVLVSCFKNIERVGYDESSWADAVQEIANDYSCMKKDGTWCLCDVSFAIERAERLAQTPVEKAHTKAATSVARRILSTDPGFNPNYTATGHWNFFNRVYVQKKSDSLCLSEYNPRWCFEWKVPSSMQPAENPIYYNDILGILQDAVNCIWSDEWYVGATPMIEYTKWDRTVKTKITCQAGGTVITKAGTFENCFKLSLDIDGMEDGFTYRGGKKVYYFAEGIGIVRTENEYCGGARTAVYELTSYTGKGKGFMPVADGLMRRYDALNLTDGFVGAVEYTCVADEDGDVVVFSDRTGIREVPPPITQYGAIEAEQVEEQLWVQGKYEESRLCHDVNNFHLLCHFLGRPSRYWGAQEKAVAWNQYRLRIMESLDNGTVPDAWLGCYASTSFRTACALFGCGRKDEGYEWLEKAFDAYPKWERILNGTEMDVGDPLICGGIQVIKGKGLLRLPDGAIQPIIYDELFEGESGLIYYGMTAPRGWEWFDPVRNEERFKEYVERAKKLTNKE